MQHSLWEQVLDYTSTLSIQKEHLILLTCQIQDLSGFGAPEPSQHLVTNKSVLRQYHQQLDIGYYQTSKWNHFMERVEL